MVRHVTLFGHGHGLQRAIIDESQHRTPELLIRVSLVRSQRGPPIESTTYRASGLRQVSLCQHYVSTGGLFVGPPYQRIGPTVLGPVRTRVHQGRPRNKTPDAPPLVRTDAAGSGALLSLSVNAPPVFQRVVGDRHRHRLRPLPRREGQRPAGCGVVRAGRRNPVASSSSLASTSDTDCPGNAGVCCLINAFAPCRLAANT